MISSNRFLIFFSDHCNTIYAGLSFLIIGYGRIGQMYANALHHVRARLSVAEIDPIRAIEACLNGCQVARIEDVINNVDFILVACSSQSTSVVTSTKKSFILSGTHFAMMDTTKVPIVANCTNHDDIIDISSADKTFRNKRTNVVRVDFGMNKQIKLLNNGKPLVSELANNIKENNLYQSVSISSQILSAIKLSADHYNSIRSSPAGELDWNSNNSNAFDGVMNQNLDFNENLEENINLELTLDSFENENESEQNKMIVSNRLCPDLIQDLPIEVDNDVAKFHLSLFKN